MKRHTKLGLGAAALLTVAVPIGIVIWVTATTTGTNWLLAALTPLSRGIISVQMVEGRIIDHLLLRGVKINLTQQKVVLDSIELRWKPLPLFTGTIAVQELTLKGVRIQDDSPPSKKAPLLTWPTIPQSAKLLDCVIARLQLTELSCIEFAKPKSIPACPRATIGLGF